MDSELAEAIQAALKCKRAASLRLVASTLCCQQLLCPVLAFPCRRGRQQPDGRRANTWLIIVDGKLSKGYFNLGISFQTPSECVQRILGEIPARAGAAGCNSGAADDRPAPRERRSCRRGAAG